MDELIRLIDINTNRACEGLRILEDQVRYTPGLEPWMDPVKGWRRMLRCLNQEFRGAGLAHRKALEDPGPSYDSSGLAVVRKDALQLFAANAARVQEAVRALEEYCRVVRPQWVKSLEACRFQVYELEKAHLACRIGAQRRQRLHTDLYGITGTAHSAGRGNVAVAGAMIDAGVRILQYREKDLSRREMYQECLRIKTMTEGAGALFIVNDHVDLALAVEADGVHIGQEDLPPCQVRSQIGPDRLMGISTHSPAQARKAVEDGADYIGVGPLFRTHTKKDVCEPVGLEYLDYAVRNLQLPLVAIGGIKRHNLPEVLRRGARLTALVTEITEAEDIGGRIREIRTIIDREEPYVSNTKASSRIR